MNKWNGQCWWYQVVDQYMVIYALYLVPQGEVRLLTTGFGISDLSTCCCLVSSIKMHGLLFSFITYIFPYNYTGGTINSVKKKF